MEQRTEGEEDEVLAYIAAVGGVPTSGMLELAATHVERLTADHTLGIGPATVDGLLLLEKLLRGGIFVVVVSV